MKKLLLMMILIPLLAGCSSKRVVVKNCDATESDDIWVCEPI